METVCGCEIYPALLYLYEVCSTSVVVRNLDVNYQGRRCFFLFFSTDLVFFSFFFFFNCLLQILCNSYSTLLLWFMMFAQGRELQLATNITCVICLVSTSKLYNRGCVCDKV